MILETLENKVGYRIKRSKDSVFIPGDFSDISEDRDQVGRALRSFVRRQELIKLGYGVYARARKSSLTGNVIPEKSLPELATETLKKLKVEVLPSSLEKLYNKGETTQVPTGRVIAVKGRISRKIGYNGKYITLEKAS